MGAVRTPRAEDAAHAGEQAFKVGRLLLQQCAEMRARRGPQAAEYNDVLDLCERQAEPTGLTDEREQLQHIGWIAPIAGWLTTRRR